MKKFTIISEKRSSLIDLIPLKKPLSLFVEPTNICNFRCAPCVHGAQNTANDLKPLGHMSMTLYEKIISDLVSWPGPSIKLLRLAMLGEPLTNPNFLEMVSLAKKAKIAERIDTFSNGSLLTSDVAEKLVDAGIDSIRFSIYSVIPERHKEVTRSRFSVEKIYQNIKNLRQIRDAKKKSIPYIHVKMFDNYGEENQLFFDLYDGIADEIGLEVVHNATRYSGNDLVKMYYGDGEKKDLADKEFSLSLHKNRIACPRPFMSMAINNIGDCLMCTHDPAKGTSIGNCNEISLQKLWLSKDMFEFRKMHLENRKHENAICANCDWFKIFPETDDVDGFPVEKLRP